MSTVPCTFEAFKQLAKEFHEALPGMNEDELAGAWHALSLAYLGMHEKQWLYSAQRVLQLCADERTDREFELQATPRRPRVHHGAY